MCLLTLLFINDIVKYKNKGAIKLFRNGARCMSSSAAEAYCELPDFLVLVENFIGPLHWTNSQHREWWWWWWWWCWLLGSDMLLQPWQIALIVIGGVLIIAIIVILIVLCKLKCCCFTCFECSCLNCCCGDDSTSFMCYRAFSSHVVQHTSNTKQQKHTTVTDLLTIWVQPNRLSQALYFAFVLSFFITAPNCLGSLSGSPLGP